jgi:hypothetical protein
MFGGVGDNKWASVLGFLKFCESDIIDSSRKKKLFVKICDSVIGYLLHTQKIKNKNILYQELLISEVRPSGPLWESTGRRNGGAHSL